MKQKERYESRFPISEPQASWDFVRWWQPTGTDPVSGASVGGHPDAERIWARPESRGRFTKRTYGIRTQVAWQADCYRNEFYDWQEQGSPARAKEFISLCLPIEEQEARWKELKGTIDRIDKGVNKSIRWTPADSENLGGA